MLVLRDLRHARGRFKKPFVTLGSFDGVHVGHQQILARLVETARAHGGTPVAITFHPHPAAILTPQRMPPLLTSLRARLNLMAAAGVEAIVVQHFTPRFSNMTAEAFVSDLLVDHVGVAGVIVGHRVSFGHKRRGTAQLLRELGACHEFLVDVVGPIEVGGTLVSSSKVREEVLSAHLTVARDLLGRWPAAYGRVRRGFQRGREIGFPTANLPVAGMAVPPDGVYATFTRVADEWVQSVSNLGCKPTFGDNERGLEVHLLDRRQFLYGQRLEVRFVERLRGEIKFPDSKALGEQIGRDVENARAALERVTPE